MLWAQKENYNWAFGYKAGLSWNLQNGETTLPSAIGENVFNLPSINGTSEIIPNMPRGITTNIQSGEGCFSVSDYRGNLLFYSSGQNLWNQAGVEIATPTILTGHNSSAQSGIIIPYPGKAGRYIAITLGTDIASDANASTDLGWTELLVNPLTNATSVVSTTKQIIPPPAGQVYKETITAVRAANKKDYWILVPSRSNVVVPTTYTERFPYYLNVYKVDENGFNTTPVHSMISTVTYANSRSSGQIRFSKDGTRFGFVSYRRSTPSGTTTTNNNNLVLGNFNPATGDISNLSYASIGTNAQNTYGIEFDSTGEYVYITTIQTTDPTSSMYLGKRYILYVYNATDFINNLPNSRTPITTIEKDYIAADNVTQNITNSNNRPYFTSILRGVDDRLYIGEYRTRNMFVITNPSTPSNLKLYRIKDILPASTYNQIGLPTYASFYFNVNMTAPNLCQDALTNLIVNITGGEGGENYLKTEINFGDGSPIHTINNPQINSSYTIPHQYPNSGNFTITLTSYDLSYNVIPASSSSVNATVSSCYLKVNPHIRVNL